MNHIIEKYIKQRDYSGSEQDIYASLVYTCFLNIGYSFVSLLERAEKEKKKIRLIDEFTEEITIDNIEIV